MLRAADAGHERAPTSSRPTSAGRAYINNDFAVFKNFNLGGVRRFQFRASLTNVFNHPAARP